MPQIRKKPHTPEFKLKVAIATIKGNKTIAEICQEYGIVGSQAHKWKRELLDNGSAIFKSGMLPKDSGKEVEKLHATIGRLTVENDFLAIVAGKCRSKNE